MKDSTQDLEDAICALQAASRLVKDGVDKGLAEITGLQAAAILNYIAIAERNIAAIHE